MKTRLSVLVFCALVGIALLSAENAVATSLDVGTWNGSGCCSDRTRGYWFVAPINFTIIGLSVPGNGDGSNSTLEVLRLNSTPPLYSGTSNDFVSLGYWSGLPTITTNIAIGVGDIVGILGWRDEFTPYRDFGDYATSLGGNPITLQRFGFQDLGAAHDVWREVGSIGVIGLDYRVGTAVPEPSTLVLAGFGILALAALRRRS